MKTHRFAVQTRCPAIFLFCCIFSLLTGCSMNKIAVNSTYGIIRNGMPAVFRENDPQFAREALPANLKLMEMLIENDPDNAGLLTTAAQGFCGYSFMFIEDENEARASAFYEKGAGYASRAYEKTAGADISRIDVKTTPPAFWYAFCKAGWINLNKDNPDALAELPRIMPLAEKIIAVDPGYYYNGAYTILGVYYAIRPKIFGGDPVRSAQYFETSVKGAGENFLLNKFMYAKTQAVAAQDAANFEKLLNGIIDAAARNSPERLPNEVARIKAKKLLEKKNELF